MNGQLTKANVIVAGQGCGEVLQVSPALSFWGGIDPATGNIIDPRHPQYGVSVAARAMVMEQVVGSSSGSSIVLELITAGCAPAVLILSQNDCIACLGVVVARALDRAGFPVLQLERDLAAKLRGTISTDESGAIYAK